MSKRFDERSFDKRVVQKYIDRGLVDKKDYEDFLNSLPDESKNSAVLKVFTEDSDLTFSAVEEVK